MAHLCTTSRSQPGTAKQRIPRTGPGVRPAATAVSRLGGSAYPIQTLPRLASDIPQKIVPRRLTAADAKVARFLLAAGTVQERDIPDTWDTLNDDESIAVDLHTHGRSRAFWSATDNRDDQGIKIAGVFGKLHHDKPDAAFRLAVNGCYLRLRNPWEVAQRGSEQVDFGAAVLEDEVLLDARPDASLRAWFGF